MMEEILKNKYFCVFVKKYSLIMWHFITSSVKFERRDKRFFFKCQIIFLGGFFKFEIINSKSPLKFEN